jgi:hypothetical protein
MLQEFLGLLLMYISILPLFLFLSLVSLAYYSAKYQVSTDTIQGFLASLPSPLKEIYVGEQSWVNRDLMKKRGKSLKDYLQTTSVVNPLLGRLILSTVPTICIIALIVGISYVTDISTLVIRIFGLLIFCITLFYCWRFGHELSKSN